MYRDPLAGPILVW